MNHNFEIRVQNDLRAIKGKELKYRKESKTLALNGDDIFPTFQNRRQAVEWAKEHGASVAVV